MTSNFQRDKVGAAAYSPKDISPEQLLQITRLVAQGHYLINQNVLSRPFVASRVLKQFRELAPRRKRRRAVRPPHRPRGGDPRLHRPWPLNKQIAMDLNISDQTVKNHITAILRKLNVNDRTQAVIYAMRHGWIPRGRAVRLSRAGGGRGGGPRTGSAPSARLSRRGRRAGWSGGGASETHEFVALRSRARRPR